MHQQDSLVKLIAPGIQDAITKVDETTPIFEGEYSDLKKGR